MIKQTAVWIVTHRDGSVAMFNETEPNLDNLRKVWGKDVATVTRGLAVYSTRDARDIWGERESV